MKVKDYAGRECDIHSAFVEADRDENGEAWFYVNGRYRGIYTSVETCIIRVFHGTEGMSPALDLLQGLRSALAAEREARGVQP